MNNKQIKFVIIVPHGFCTYNNVRHCDKNALSNAEKLKKILMINNHDVNFFVADKLRANGDYNRHESYNTPWRTNIRNTIKTHLDDGYRVIIFEIHSFPLNYPYFESDCSLGMFSIPSREDNMYFLSDFLTQRGTKVCPVKSHNINDLQWDFYGVQKEKKDKKGDIDHYFIEFSEHNPMKEEQQDLVLNNIYTGALEFLKTPIVSSLNYNLIYLVLLLLFIFIFIILHNRFIV